MNTPKTATQILTEALETSLKNPEMSLGDCLRGHAVFEVNQIESLLDLSYNEIADQFYETAPKVNTQIFLDRIEFIKTNYHKYY